MAARRGGVRKQAEHRPGELLAVDAVVGNHHGSPRVREQAGVGGLVVCRGMGVGHEHARHAAGGDLGHRARPRPRDHEVGGRKARGHVVYVGHDAPTGLLAFGQAQGGERLLVVLGPGRMEHIGPLMREDALLEGGKRAVEVAGAQASPEHKQHRGVGGQPEGRAALLACGVQDRPAHGVAQGHHLGAPSRPAGKERL